jgi:hypothetical protein
LINEKERGEHSRFWNVSACFYVPFFVKFCFFMQTQFGIPPLSIFLLFFILQGVLFFFETYLQILRLFVGRQFQQIKLCESVPNPTNKLQNNTLTKKKYIQVLSYLNKNQSL